MKMIKAKKMDKKMTVQRKIILVVLMAIGIMLGCLLMQNIIQQKQVKSELAKTVTSFSRQSKANTAESLLRVSQSTSEYIISLEKAVDDNMLNAAYYLQTYYANHPNMTNQDLKAMKKKLAMTDLLICDRKGDFILSSDDASLNLNLFNIWDGYRNLLKDPTLVIPSDLKISAEGGGIYKYTSIPTLNGKGALEVELNSSEIKQSIENFCNGTAGFKNMVMVDNSQVVVLNIGNSDGNSDGNTEGEATTDEIFPQVIDSAETVTEVGEDTSVIYYPLKKKDVTTYVVSAC